MSTKEKLIKRFLALPKDFTFDELLKLLTALGFVPMLKIKGDLSDEYNALQRLHR
jgi:hypothetical protein